MLRLTHPRTYTCTHTYCPPISSNTFCGVECFRSIGAGFGNRNSDRDCTSCPEEGEVRLWFPRRSCMRHDAFACVTDKFYWTVVKRPAGWRWRFRGVSCLLFEGQNLSCQVSDQNAGDWNFVPLSLAILYRFMCNSVAPQAFLRSRLSKLHQTLSSLTPRQPLSSEISSQYVVVEPPLRNEDKC
jgi:hypothetical protein